MCWAERGRLGLRGDYVTIDESFVSMNYDRTGEADIYDGEGRDGYIMRL